MNDWFKWRGQTTDEYGVVVTEQPAIILGEERVSFESVTGRSGSVAYLEDEAGEVFEDITLEFPCYIRDASRVNELAQWLRGGGRLAYPLRPDGEYEARIINAIEIERIMRGRTQRRFTAAFRCNPLLYMTDVPDIVITQSQTLIRNPGSVASAPKITITGSGDFDISIGGQMMGFVDIEDGVVIDSYLQDVFNPDQTALLNENAKGALFTLPVGSSMVSWQSNDENDNAGSVTRIVIEPRWRIR